MDSLVVRAAIVDEVDQVVAMYQWLFAPPGARGAVGRGARGVRPA